METVITSDRHMIMERHWPKETAEGLKAGCSGLGEQVEVDVVRGRRVREAAGGCATGNRQFSSESLFEINHNKV